MTPNKVYLATRVDRLWHWVHALGIVLLILTGLQIHFVEKFPIFRSYDQALYWHNIIGLVVVFDWGLWLLYNLLSGRFARYYRPNRDDLPAGMMRQGMFYGMGIFKGDPHPFPVGETRKFNPLQKWTYLGVMAILVPFQIVTGLYLYAMVTGFIPFHGADALPVSVLHTAASFLVAMFVVSHIYLGTTGHKPWDQFRFMITGYHDDEQANH
uniref:Thiosulfate reductase cytochrome b subunit n=1 Tax=Candidatus Kentrum eta TaxID=2126337 RepID=A0A450UJS2_9GAMM|nr:MAG: Thiosulfate reductase cytochrome b subunit [Candidatus Kentron sp. H]VFJ93885.1 MAG: Thiosulfate reductase cytochrome b subunit [Candidatus Kentron sp. H]VFK00396.1 MAG: Thiosulfate reductase cytochrome b subunit [Candidatus Kentron sp. H]